MLFDFTKNSNRFYITKNFDLTALKEFNERKKTIMIKCKIILQTRKKYSFNADLRKIHITNLNNPELTFTILNFFQFTF